MTTTRIDRLADGARVLYPITLITDFRSMTDYDTVTIEHAATFNRTGRARVVLDSCGPNCIDNNHDRTFVVTVAMAHGETLETIDR